MQQRLVPVVDATGRVIGEARESAHKVASELLGAPAAQNFREVNGRRVLCWTPAAPRK